MSDALVSQTPLGSNLSVKVVTMHQTITIRLRTYTLAHLCDIPEGTPTAARVEISSGIIISSDEIDNDKTDTERAQQNTPPTGPEDFLSQRKN